jgi:hypothetical protein
MSCNCGNSRCCVPQKGERGLRGKDGPQGPIGPEGPQGPAGNDGNDGQDGVILDTGWHDLEGFNHYQNVQRPQARRIGNVIHFRGIAIVPLSSDGGTTVETLNGATAYYGIFETAPYTGVGGVDLNSNGSVIFNESASCIPTTVLAANVQLDGSYNKPFINMVRPIRLDGNNGTALTAICTITIQSNKALRLGVLKDLEIIQGGGDQFLGSSPFRYITSDIREDNVVPNYIDPDSFIHNLDINPSAPPAYLNPYVDGFAGATG